MILNRAVTSAVLFASVLFVAGIAMQPSVDKQMRGTAQIVTCASLRGDLGTQMEWVTRYNRLAELQGQPALSLTTTPSIEEVIAVRVTTPGC